MPDLDRVRHQQGLQPRRRRDVFGDRGGRAGRGAARDSEHCRVARALRAATTTSAPRPPPAPASPRWSCRSGLPPRTFLNINVPPGQPKGIRVTVQAQAQPHHRRRRSATIRAAGLLLDRGRAERVGAARSLGLPGGQGRLHVGDAAAARPDGARRDDRRSTAGCGTDSRGPSAALQQRRIVPLEVSDLRQVHLHDVGTGRVAPHEVLMLAVRRRESCRSGPPSSRSAGETGERPRAA